MKLNTLILTASLGLAATAPAAIITLHETGTFGPTTELGGSPFGVVTPFDFHATFDSTTDFDPHPGWGLFPITSFSILIGGTPYTAPPAPNLNVQLVDPAIAGLYFAGMSDAASDTYFLNAFRSATPGFSVNAPTPSGARRQSAER